LNEIAPLSKNVAEISTTLLSIINSKKIKAEDVNNGKELLLKLQKPVVDVELIVLEDLNKLFIFIINEKGGKNSFKN
jgi:hexosaminidase